MKNVYYFSLTKTSHVVFLLSILFSVFLLDTNSFAQQLTQGITYQGKLIENGQPFTGSQTIFFELLDNAGNIPWSETQTVNVQDGLYSVVLGNQTPFTPNFFERNPNLNLRVTINGNVLSPNVPLRATPYAHAAGGVIRNSIGTLQIRDGAILPLDIASGGSDKLLGTNANGRVVWLDRSTAVAPTGTAGGDLTGTYPNPEIGSGRVDSDNILDGTIATVDLADGSVTTDKLGTAGLTDADKVFTTDASGNPQLTNISTFSSSTLNSTNIYVGNTSNIATGVALSGDATLDNTGVLTIADDAVTLNKLQNGTPNQVFGTDGSGEPILIDQTTLASTIDTDEQDLTDVLSFGNDANGNSIINLLDPLNPQDAATKNYVDTEIASSASLDGDTDATNELQDLNLTSNILTIVGGSLPTTSIDLTPYLDNTDAQDLSLTGTTLSLTNDGTPVDLSSINTDNQDLSLVGNSLSLTNDATPVDLSLYLDNTDAQDLSLTGTTLSLTNDGTPVDLSSINTDNQDLSISATELEISNGTNVLLSDLNTGQQDLSLGAVTAATRDINIANGTGVTINIQDGDANPTNELQTLSLAGSDLTLSNGGGTVILPTGTTYTAGTGIDLSSNIVTNTAPDQTIVLTGTGATSITGTYPNFTINSTDNNTIYTAGTGINIVGNVINSTVTNTDNQNLTNVLLFGNSAGGNKITDLGMPTVATDATTKTYVDGLYLGNNGITRTGTTFGLGGTLTANTDINLGTNHLNFWDGYVIVGENITSSIGRMNIYSTPDKLGLYINTNDLSRCGMQVDTEVDVAGALFRTTGGGRAAEFFRTSGAVSANAIVSISEGSSVATGNALQIDGGASTNITLGIKNNNIGGLALEVRNNANGLILDLNNAGNLRANNYNNISDIRYKKNILTLTNSLSTIQKLRGTSYYWKDESKGDKIQFGVIAQEIEEIFPNLVHTDSEGYKSVNYIGIVPVLIEATKEQQTIIEAQEEKISKLETQVQELKELVLLLKDENDSNSTLSKKVDALEKQLTSLVNQLSELTAQK